MADDVEAMKAVCRKPNHPAGWHCRCSPGHVGPCSLKQDAKLPAPTPVATPQTKGLCKWCSVPWCGETVNAVCPVRQPHGMPHVWENDHPVATGEAKLPLDAPSPQARSEGQEPMFKVGQIAVMKSMKREMPFRVLSVEQHDGEWFYGWNAKNSSHEKMLRKATLDEIGASEPTGKAEGVELPPLPPIFTRSDVKRNLEQRERQLRAALSRVAELELWPPQLLISGCAVVSAENFEVVKARAEAAEAKVAELESKLAGMDKIVAAVLVQMGQENYSLVWRLLRSVGLPPAPEVVEEGGKL